MTAGAFVAGVLVDPIDVSGVREGISFVTNEGYS
jgi:hypothetical protein